MNAMRGVALVTALFVSVVAASVAASLAADGALDRRRTMVTLYRDQAIQVAVGSEGWVRSILREDGVSSPNDHLEEIWATDIPVLPIESDAVRGEIWGQLEDLQGRFNVNNLVAGGTRNDAAYDQFQRLLAALQLEPFIADAVVDWLDANQQEEIPGGAEDPIYTGLIPAYRTADRQISNVTELAAINGVDPVSFEILLPHVAALPAPSAVNVNTATYPVLQSLGPNLTEADAEGIDSMRAGGGIVDLNELVSIVSPDLMNNPSIGITESSQYFQLKAVVQIDTVRVSLFTVMHRNGNNEVTPILRSLGTL